MNLHPDWETDRLTHRQSERQRAWQKARELTRQKARSDKQMEKDYSRNLLVCLGSVSCVVESSVGRSIYQPSALLREWIGTAPALVTKWIWAPGSSSSGLFCFRSLLCCILHTLMDKGRSAPNMAQCVLLFTPSSILLSAIVVLSLLNPDTCGIIKIAQLRNASLYQNWCVYQVSKLHTLSLNKDDKSWAVIPCWAELQRKAWFSIRNVKTSMYIHASSLKCKHVLKFVLLLFWFPNNNIEKKSLSFEYDYITLTHTCYIKYIEIDKNMKNIMRSS